MDPHNPLRGHPLATALGRQIVDLIGRMLDDRLRPFTTGGKLDLGKRDGIVGFVPVGNGGTGGGAHTLASLTDVAIASPADGDTLVYVAADQKWHNRRPLKVLTLNGQDVTLDGADLTLGV